MIALSIVPIPGFCLKGIHRNNTAILTINVIVPIDKLTFKEIPWARTLQGDAPELDTINNPSPKPNKVKPNIRKNKLEGFGFKFKGLSELQETLGTFLIDKNIY
jgi:hypothetical protein